MSEIGGPLAQSGFFYQNSIAALFLAKMILEQNISDELAIEQVKNEAWEETVCIDDVLVRYQDGHRCFVQVKEKISPGSKAWKELWEYVQRQEEMNFDKKHDRILLYIDQLTDPKLELSLLDLKELCRRTRKQTRYDGFRKSGDHKIWFGLISKQITPVKNSQGDMKEGINKKHQDHVVSILSYVDVEYSSREKIAKILSDNKEKYNVPANTLIRILRDIAAESAIYKQLWKPDELCEKLETDHGIKIKRHFERMPFEPETEPIDDNKEFLMGNDEYENEAPKHYVLLKPYRIGKYPVTKSQFAKYVEENQPFSIAQLGWESMVLSKTERDQPVTGVKFIDALKYCEWLSTKTGRKYRLPNEAEWEKAARGNKGNIYPWGDIWDEEKFRNNNKSPSGCWNMVGNIYEWTCSLWGYRYEKPDKKNKYPWQADDGRNNQDANPKILRVLRGGTYVNQPAELRCSRRICDEVSSRGDEAGGQYGFRIVLEVG